MTRSTRNEQGADLSREERELFRNTMQDSYNARMLASQEASPSYSLQSQAPLNIPPPSDPLILDSKVCCTPEETIHFAKHGISYRTRHKLKRGQFTIEGQLDLHGLTSYQALEKTAYFFQKAMQEQKRCVLVIHGKGSPHSHGGPILKNLLNQWLRQQVCVLAYHSARSKDGGTGALYVLLARIP